MQRLMLAAALVTVAGAGTAAAEEMECNVPEAQWQPQSVLQQKLESEGWTVRSIEVDNGCYEVYAVNAEGDRMEGEFNPQTLALLANEAEEEDDDGDGF
ncbi:MAG: PepSY domain-containing protein [Alphaproteobacteria bacterium]